MKAYPISWDCLRIDINHDEAQELIGREGSIPTNEWGAIRPSVQAFVRSYRIAAACQIIDKQRAKIEELETQIRDELELLPLRDEQSDAVMPLIGPLLDAWDGLSNDARNVIEQESPQLAKALRDINDAMEGYDLLGEFTDRDVDYEFGREES